jgi:hypothetical protein
MKYGCKTQNRIKIKIKITDRYKKYRRTKAANGADDFGKKGQKQEYKINVFQKCI